MTSPANTPRCSLWHLVNIDYTDGEGVPCSICGFPRALKRCSQPDHAYFLCSACYLNGVEAYSVVFRVESRFPDIDGQREWRGVAYVEVANRGTDGSYPVELRVDKFGPGG